MEGEGSEFAEVQVAETPLATDFECSTYVVCLTCHSEFSELGKVLLQVRQTAYVELEVRCQQCLSDMHLSKFTALSLHLASIAVVYRLAEI